MADFKEYEKLDGLGLAELVRKKKVHPLELLESAVSRIERKNPSLNAVIHKFYDKARKTASEKIPDGPFCGVPFLLKDLLAAYAGEPMSSGSRAYRNYIPLEDSELVRRFKNAGTVILGKTNTPEFGLMGVTEPELHGPTLNPWDTARTPGGSSGGAAAAVSSGMVPIASAGDGGGSIRIPASNCGVFGLKPSRGRNPTGPIYGELWQGAAVEHIISRSVRDSAAMLDFTCGDDSGSPYPVSRPEKPYSSLLSRNGPRLRIAFSSASPVGRGVHNDNISALNDAVSLLQSLGHKVEEKHPDIDGNELAMSYLTMYFGETAEEIRAAGKILGRKPRRSDFEGTTWLLGLLGRVYTAGDFASAMKVWNRLGRIMGKFHETYDLYLTPALAYPPVKIGELAPKPGEKIAMDIVNMFGLGKLMKATGMVQELALKSLEKSPFTQLANLTGQPAMSVPLYWSKENLPIGVQFIAPMGREDVLFQLAAELERARPWFDKRPPEIG